MALLITYPCIAHLREPWLSIMLNIASMLKANCVVSRLRISVRFITWCLLKHYSYSEIKKAYFLIH